jgi:hypothetical protein
MANFCSNTGRPHSQVPEGKFCGDCGMLPPSANASSSQPNPPPTPSPTPYVSGHLIAQQPHTLAGLSGINLPADLGLDATGKALKGKQKERELARRQQAYNYRINQQSSMGILHPVPNAVIGQAVVSTQAPSTPEVAAEPIRFVAFAAIASSSDLDTCEWHWKPFLAFRITFLPNKEWYFSLFKNHVIDQLETNANTLELAAGLDSSKNTCLIGMYHNNAKTKPPIKVQLLANGWSGKLSIGEIVNQLGWRTGKDQKDDDVNQESVYTVSIMYVPHKQKEEREITPAHSAFDTFSQLGSMFNTPEPEAPALTASTTQDQLTGVGAIESTVERAPEQADGETAQANSHRRRISAVVPRAERVSEGRPSRRRRAPAHFDEA